MKTNNSKKFLYHRFSRMFGRALLVTLVAITPLYAMELQHPSAAPARTRHKPYACGYQCCSRAFESLGALVIHERIHTGEKPYGCDYCDRTFAQKGDLNSHLRTHTGQKPHRCTYQECTKSFARADSLLNHVRRKHTHEKFYGCNLPDCPYACVKLSELRIHKKKKHNVTDGTFIRLNPVEHTNPEEIPPTQNTPSSNENEMRPFLEYALAVRTEPFAEAVTHPNPTTLQPHAEEDIAYEWLPHYYRPADDSEQQYAADQHEAISRTVTAPANLLQESGEVTPLPYVTKYENSFLAQQPKNVVEELLDTFLKTYCQY